MKDRPLPRSCRWIFGILLACAPALAEAQNVVIQEIMADNKSALAQNGAYPDWIELRNLSASEVSLSGMSLTDTPSVPDKFVFPANTSIPAGGYLLVWCDTQPGPLRTGFTLKASGHSLYLYDAPARGGAQLQAVTFGLQVADLSISRFGSGAGAYWDLSQPTPSGANQATPLGSGSSLRINEWMPAPLSGSDWFELYNPLASPVAVGGFTLSDDAVATTLPPLSFLAARSWTVFVASGSQEGGLQVGFKISAVQDSITLRNAQGQVVDSVAIQNHPEGISGGRLPDGAATLAQFPGTDSEGNPNYKLLPQVVINEVLSHTDAPLEDAVEIRNLSGSPVDLSGWYLSDEKKNQMKYRIPNGTLLPAGGYRVFYEYQFNASPGQQNSFTFNSAFGDQVYLAAVDGSGALTGYRAQQSFGASENGYSFGRFVTSVGAEFVPMSSRSFGSDNPATLAQFRQGGGLPNPYPRMGPVVINELHYNPVMQSGTNVIELPDEEFVELHNITSSEVTLAHRDFPSLTWRLRNGIEFDFAPGTRIPAGGFLLVVPFNPADTAAADAFRSKYNVPAGVALLGPYTGRLSNAGETVELQKPDAPQGSGPDQGHVPYLLVERIQFSDREPWPPDADGTGKSLQRRASAEFGNEPLNWLADLPTAGRINARDSDGDGMPDSWESQYSFNSQSAADAAEDPDQDGHTNLQEYRAGTHPRQASSTLRFAEIEYQWSPGIRVGLRFSAAPWRSYTVQYADSLAAPAWTTLGHVPIQPQARTETLWDEATVPGRFYRIVTPSRE